MTRRDQYGHLLFSSKTQPPSTETTLVSIFAIQRQSSPIEHKDEYDHLPPLIEDSMSFDRSCYNTPFLLSRGNQVRWHAKTVVVSRFLCPETINVPFPIQRQMSLMV